MSGDLPSTLLTHPDSKIQKEGPTQRPSVQVRQKKTVHPFVYPSPLSQDLVPTLSKHSCLSVSFPELSSLTPPEVGNNVN